MFNLDGFKFSSIFSMTFNIVFLNQVDETGEIIILSGCNRKVPWQFPKQTTQCPSSRCRKQFDIRSDVIKHYKSMHAMKSTLCFVCKKSVSTRNINDLRWHCKKNHPAIDFDELEQKIRQRNDNSSSSSDGDLNRSLARQKTMHVLCK